MEPLFDALAHPTLSGRWLGREVAADFDSLVASLREAGYARACAIGLDGVEGYAHEPFMAACRRHPELVPVAGFNLQRDGSPAALQALREMGFVGIKMHARFSGLTQQLGLLGPAMQAAGDAGLVVFYCTYMHCGVAGYPRRDPFESLVELLAQAPQTRVVLVHGGDVSLLRYAELVRHEPRLLLDLSLTMMKYAGSSIDQDLGFLFRRFDRRICIGTDWPEYSPAAVRQRFETLAQGIGAEQRRRIAGENLMQFLGLGGDAA
jgi:predicted TIM-barrel fold metal-dependent hydrolase